MSTWEIKQFPERAVQPSILYLHVGGEIPAAAAQTVLGEWQILIFGTDTDVVFAKDEDAAREWLTALGQAAAA